MATPKRCEHIGKKGLQCTRKARWSNVDDSMRVHQYCTQHRNLNLAQGFVDLKEPFPRCHATTSHIRCECAQYSCLFKKIDGTVKGPLINKGKGLHANTGKKR